MKTPLMNYNILEDTRKIFYIEVGTKKFPLSITDTDHIDPDDGKIVYIECEGANLAQEYLESDLYLLFSDIAEMIQTEQKKNATNRVNFRLSTEEKIQIEQNAKKYGFKNVSQFLKTLGKNPEKFLTNTH